MTTHGRYGQAKTKKSVILKALADGKPVPVAQMAKALYGLEGPLGEFKIVSLLNAYRAKDPAFLKIRVRNKHICVVDDPPAGP